MTATSAPSAAAGSGLAPYLHLETLGADRFRAEHIARNVAGPIFGGQLLGSAMRAAAASVRGQRPHMMQAFFLRAGDPQAPLELEVERSKDGRRFAHRRVCVRQPGKLLLTAEVSFHDDEPAPEHETAQAPQVPPPEDLPDITELAARHRDALSPRHYTRLLGRPTLQIRLCDADAALFRSVPDTRFAMWIRPAGKLPDSAAVHAAALAFMSDNWLASAAVTPHVDHILDGQWAASSLNHALWLHRAPEVDDWLLYAVESPIARGRRGFCRGQLFNRRGELVASAAQECLLQASGEV